MTQSDQDAKNAAAANNTDSPPSAAAETGGVRPGIYLEEKNSPIGTGATAKTTQYRNFWVTLKVLEKSAEMVLLDDDFRPTAIRQIFAHEVLLGTGWHYIAEGEKRYNRLRPYLDRMLAPPAAPKAAAQPAAASGGGKWWEGGSEKPAANPFELDKSQSRATKPAPKKGGWWEK